MSKTKEVTLTLTEVGIDFLKTYLKAVETGKLTPQASPETLQRWLDGYKEIKSQLEE